MRHTTCTFRNKAVAAVLTLIGTIATGAPLCLAAARSAAPAAKSAVEEADSKPEPINVNTADVDTLTELPGVGHAIAQRIVEYRKEHGPFKSVDELLNVRGIGDRSLARMRDRVTVGGRS